MEEEVELLNTVRKGFILYNKHDIIVKEKTPDFGEITLYFQDGKFTHLVKKETKK
ncbi:hypothetical protein [Streptococcus suis]|uniref:hypothetical protein n=1 Tax=Streptococcus suis TaxID=1307 RepID=UPI0015563ECF|nr:hypothetical protein [Streptococcus suis]MBY5025362.1 hypothetical protein [Streptococcus suis]MCK3935647.1 hypothetical protein [Streptococcus suis]MCQ8264105.1 hypothetical protein [Streptococcus suis]MCQ9226230.1 hypothetical protein [Streptococcus suis]MCQ9228175.1 hypothetical protein [Streptococcus suis]